MKKILFIYQSMIIGGSTTSLLSFLNCLSPEKYEIDLQLMRNEGPLLSAIPSHVNLLPPAEKYTGVKGRIIKLFKFVFSGYIFKSFFMGITGNKKRFLSRGIAGDFQAKLLSRENLKKYDYAIGNLEGWADRYLAYSVKADKKYAWLHSTFKNITTEPREELPWMKLVDKIVFVADGPLEAFKKEVPVMANKAIAIENITDDEIIKKRSFDIDDTDKEYSTFAFSKLFKLVTVCRLTVSVKGLDRIVSCAKELKASGEKFLWYIIGDGAGKEELLKLISDADVANCVVPIGKRMNPYPFIAAADVMCMPSRYEGKPMTVTESLIIGTPPIVTKYLSANEQIRNGIDGIVVENCDDSIIPIIKDCLKDPEKIARLKRNAQNTKYGNTEYIKEIERLLFDD